MSAEEFCSHGVPFFTLNPQCLECQLVWHEDMLRFARDRVVYHEKQLEMITSYRDKLLGESK